MSATKIIANNIVRVNREGEPDALLIRDHEGATVEVVIVGSGMSQSLLNASAGIHAHITLDPSKLSENGGMEKAGAGRAPAGGGGGDGK